MDPPVSNSAQPAKTHSTAACACQAPTTSKATCAEPADPVSSCATVTGQTHKCVGESSLASSRPSTLQDQSSHESAAQHHHSDQPQSKPSIASVTTASTPQHDKGQSENGCLATSSSLQHEEAVASISGHIAGYSWQLPPGVSQGECIMMWVGPDTTSALTHLHLTFNRYGLICHLLYALSRSARNLDATACMCLRKKCLGEW